MSAKRYGIDRAEVVDYGFMNNNSVVIQEIKGTRRSKPRDVVAEWCTVITRVEDLPTIDVKTTGGPVNDNGKPPRGRVAKFIKDIFKT